MKTANLGSTTPHQLGYRWPAEWEPHRATWLVWPHNRATWPGRFEEARRQYAQLVEAIARFEQVELLAVGEAADSARSTLPAHERIRIHSIATNDSWIRDHGPIFLGAPHASSPQLDDPSREADHRQRRVLSPALLDCGYNAWGGKYPPFDLDNLVPAQIAQFTQRQSFVVPMILEGGSIEGNGQGVVLTTEPCLLNPNRNPQLSRVDIEAYLKAYLSAEHVVWLTGEVAGDDTDSHIDQIARFVNAHTVLVLDDPQTNIFAVNEERLRRWSREAAIPLTILPLRAPQPRRDGAMDLPASYANFYLVNGGVLVPVFDDPADAAACQLLADCFPDRQVVPLRADDLIYGLGAFHCLTQQEPIW